MSTMSGIHERENRLRDEFLSKHKQLIEEYLEAFRKSRKDGVTDFFELQMLHQKMDILITKGSEAGSQEVISRYLHNNEDRIINEEEFEKGRSK